MSAVLGYESERVVLMKGGGYHRHRANTDRTNGVSLRDIPDKELGRLVVEDLLGGSGLTL